MLDDDMVSHGLISQCLEQTKSSATPLEKRLESALTELLASGNVEIGVAKMTTPDYVEFTAWNGTVEERVGRAVDAVDAANGPDKEFSYWLCLRKNVDRFEGNDE